MFFFRPVKPPAQTPNYYGFCLNLFNLKTLCDFRGTNIHPKIKKSNQKSTIWPFEAPNIRTFDPNTQKCLFNWNYFYTHYKRIIKYYSFFSATLIIIIINLFILKDFDRFLAAKTFIILLIELKRPTVKLQSSKAWILIYNWCLNNWIKIISFLSASGSSRVDPELHCVLMLCSWFFGD